MINKYTLGGAVFGIFLLAIMGIRSAANWLAQSNAEQDSIVSVNTNRLESDRSSRVRSEANPVISQSDGISETIPNSPLQEAGTYIQRQKRVDQDQIIAKTEVDVIPIAELGASTAPNTTGTNESVGTTPTPRPTPSTPPASPPVPALW